MPGVKISELPAATTPLAGTELLAIVQGGVTKQASADAVSDAVLDEFAASSGSSLVGFLQSGAGAQIRTVQSKLRDVVSVKDFGAVGDGVTDDTAAIQAAITSLTNGGTVLFPQGTYLVSQAVEITRSNITLEGGRGSTIKLKDSSVGTLAYGSIIIAFQKLNVIIRGLSIDGNKANNDINDNYGNGINILDCQRVQVLNCYVYNCPRDGITVSRQTVGPIGNEDILISGNLVTGCGAASQTTGGEGILVVQGNRIEITNNICTGNKYRGIEIETLSTVIKNVICTGNVCNSNLYGGIGCNGSDQFVVSNNICDSNTSYGIRVNSISVVYGLGVVSNNRIKGSTYGIAIENYRDMTVSGNIIDGSGTGIYIVDGVWLTINGNFVSGTTGHGINFLSGSNQDLVFSGNYVRASNQSAGSFDNVTGNATYVLFSGNRVGGTSARYGINTAGSGWWITDNLLDDSGSSAAINDGASGSKIRNNRGYVTEAKGSATITSAATSVTVTHGCSTTPSLGDITITGGEDPTTSVGTIYVDTITSTQFTVRCETAPGASEFTFGWRVQIV